MKRRTKNILMITTVLFLLVISFLTARSVLKPFPSVFTDSTDVSDVESKNDSSDDIDIKKLIESRENSDKNSDDVSLPQLADLPDLSDIAVKSIDDVNGKHVKVESPYDEYHTFFIIVSVVGSGVVMYLILSRFNKKTFKETFEERGIIFLYILTTPILFGILMFLFHLFTK